MHFLYRPLPNLPRCLKMSLKWDLKFLSLNFKPIFISVVHFKCTMKITPLLDLTIDFFQTVFFSHQWGLGLAEGKKGTWLFFKVVFSYFGTTPYTFLKLFLMNSEADMMILHYTKGSHKNGFEWKDKSLLLDEYKWCLLRYHIPTAWLYWGKNPQ